jgi:hypothetical protein
MIDVNGMIYDFSNRPVSNYTITLGEKLTSVSDINGRFYFSKVPADTYDINGSKEGYETYKDTVTIGQKEQIIYLRIPSVSQLLDLADESLSKPNLLEAESYIQRAANIGVPSTELFFYSAVISFRKKEYTEAINYLMEAKEAGSTDIYLEQFLNDLTKLINVDEEANDETI